MDENWTRRFIGLCDHLASWSEDPHFQVGCVVVGAGHSVLTSGYNGLPRGVSATDATRFDRASGEKFHWVEHAERNAIFNAARTGVALDGATLFVNRFPCADCARAIIQSGVASVISPSIPAQDGKLDHSFQVSRKMLEEAGVRWTPAPG